MAKTTYKLKIRRGDGSIETMDTYDSTNDVSHPRVALRTTDGTVIYTPLDDITHAGVSHLRNRIGSDIYAVISSSSEVNKDTLTLTNSLYKMSDIYPDIYTTMTEVPDKLDTLQLTTTKEMFQGCAALTSIPDIDTSNVENMDRMFNGCSSLISVPLFDTSITTSMMQMFKGCTSLTSIPAFDTGNLTDMYAMFEDCSSITQIPVFDTTNVTYMQDTFRGCSSLVEIPAFNTSRVTNMFGTFSGCSSITTIPLLDTLNVTDMRVMFALCSSLVSIPSINTSNVVLMEQMFAGCSSLTTAPELNTSKAVNMVRMYQECPALQFVPTYNISSVICIDATEHYTAGTFAWDSVHDVNMTLYTYNNGVYGMFKNCNNLVNVTFSNTDESSKQYITSPVLKSDQNDNTLSITFTEAA